MSERERESKVERIVVAFDTTPLGEAALEAAAGLAAALDAELAGLFVEDVNLMRMAELPFTLEFGLTSAAARPIGAGDIERAFKLQAEHSRARLEAIASALALRWSFRVVRGHVFATVLENMREPDLVVFGKGAHGPIAKSVRLPELAGVLRGAAGARRERFQRLRLRSVALVFDGSPQAWRAIAAAYALAVTAKTRLALFIMAETRRDFEHLREPVKAWLTQRGATARFVCLQGREVSSVVEAVNAEDAAALLWYDGTALQDRAAIRALLSGLHCPLVLVS